MSAMNPTVGELSVNITVVNETTALPTTERLLAILVIEWFRQPLHPSTCFHVSPLVVTEAQTANVTISVDGERNMEGNHAQLSPVYSFCYLMLAIDRTRGTLIRVS